MIAGDIVGSRQPPSSRPRHDAPGFITSVVTRLLHARPDRARLRRRSAGGDRRRRRDAALRLQRGGDPRALSRDRRRVRRLSAPRCTTRSRPTPRSAIARLLRDLGSAVDANSIWEIEVARRAGFPPADIVFTGVGKSPAELECAGRARPEGDQRRVGRRARARRGDRRGGSARSRASRSASTRTSTRRATRTSRPASRSTSSACRSTTRASCSRSMAARPRLKLVAIHVHVGSQITTLEPLRRRGARSSPDWPASCRPAASPLEYVDLGGGLGISYDGADVPLAAASTWPRSWTKCARPACRSSSSRAARSSARPARWSRTVIDLKPRNAASEFAVIDAGMTELMRPALYNAFHRIEPVRPARRRPRHYEIVGPVCESSDVVGRDRLLPPLAVGDLRGDPRRRRLRRRRWRRTTIAVRCRPKCWSTTGAGASSAGGRRSTTCLRWSRLMPGHCSSRSKGSTRAASRRRPSCCAIA